MKASTKSVPSRVMLKASKGRIIALYKRIQCKCRWKLRLLCRYSTRSNSKPTSFEDHPRHWSRLRARHVHWTTYATRTMESFLQSLWIPWRFQINY